MCTENLHYAVTAIGNLTTQMGIMYAQSMLHRLRLSKVQIKLLPDIAQDLEVHLQDWRVRCDLADDFAGSVQK